MFNVKDFNKAKFTTRTATVAVPELAYFFGDGEPAEFEIRGLTGAELARCNDARDKRANATLFITQMKLSSEDLATIKELLGNTESLPPDIVRRLEMLDIVFAGVGLPTWVKVTEHYPITFYQLTNKILELSGQGSIVEKPAPSGTSSECVD